MENKELELTQEMLDKAKGAETVQELLELAKAEGIELTEEAAKEAFAKLHPQSGELSDEELENVAGGGSLCERPTEYFIQGPDGVKTNMKNILVIEHEGWTEINNYGRR